jgi:hypothetical protein
LVLLGACGPSGGNTGGSGGGGGGSGSGGSSGGGGSSGSGGTAGSGGSGGSGGGGATNFEITGLVSAGNSQAAPSPLSDAKITASIDKNKDGTIGAGEQWNTTSDSNGAYTLAVDVAQGDRLVVAFTDAGKASIVRNVEAAPNGKVQLNATLTELEGLECKDGKCNVKDNALLLRNLPAGVTGSAKIFNPVTQTDAFPGEFKDNTGNLLISGVFATFEMEQNGQPLKTLSSPATVQMRMPRDTWNVIVDITTGNSQIDVPLYSFDETKGEWVRDGAGWLEDGNGAKIDPATLPSIKNGTYNGVVVAVGEVTHFSTWNVDWPGDTHGCIKVCVTDSAGAAAAGATVSLAGVTYTGTSTPKTAGADGCVCIEGMRSEAAGEDVDNDGTTGETQKVGLRVAHGGKYYDLGVFDMPAANATCGGTGCTDLGVVQLTSAKELSIALCTVNGTVRDIQGNPVANATVYGFDESVPDDAMEAMCFDGTTYLCMIATSTDATGAYAVTMPVLNGATIMGMIGINTPPEQSTYYGQRGLRGCPTGSIDLTLDQGYRTFTLTVSVNGNTISWTPDNLSQRPMNGYVMVSNSSAGPKWMVVTDEGIDLASPVTYGTIPPNASQTFPATGSPAALASGDEIAVWLQGLDDLGRFIWATGTITVP